ANNSLTRTVPDIAPNQTVACTGGPGTATLAYQWLRNGSPIASATSASYLVDPADAGTQLQCQVTATSVEGASVATSSPLTVSPNPASPPPVPLSGPSVRRTSNAGQPLTCSEA